MVTYLVSTLDHTLLALHLDVLLLFGVGQSPRDTEKEGAGADDPQRLTAEQDARLCEGGDGVDSAGELAAGGGGDDVFQGIETVVEGLAVKLKVGLNGDLGFCVNGMLEDGLHMSWMIAPMDGWRDGSLRYG